MSRYDLSDLPIEEIQSLATERADNYIKNQKDEICNAKKKISKCTDAMRIDYKMSFSNGVKSDEIDIIAISKERKIRLTINCRLLQRKLPSNMAWRLLRPN